MALVGCELSDPQGTDTQWDRPEQRRLEALKDRCDGQPWESEGVFCADYVLNMSPIDSSGPDD